MNESTKGAEARWRAGPAQELVWSNLGDMCVAYHRPSGRTHFFNEATADLLEHVLAAPRTALAAAEALAAREEAVPDAAFVAAVADSLAHLAHLGLIKRCDT
jgi:PqqD family protein of HPr-rel-A system